MSTMGRGLYLSAAEKYRLTDWFALGAHVEYMRSSSSTVGFYQGSEISQIDVSYGAHVLGVVLGGDITFVDLGLRLGASGGVGYFHTILDRNVVFQIPAEYPDAIAGVPPEGEGRYTGGAFGLEAGITLSYPVFEWFTIGTQIIGRSRLAQYVPRCRNGLEWRRARRISQLKRTGRAIHVFDQH